MKSIENEYKSIKNDYGDRINSQIRNKLQKYMAIVREMNKFQLVKTSQDRQSVDKIIPTIRNQFHKIRREIQSQIKISMSDYQAYMWKLEKNGNSKPVYFQQTIKIPAINGIQYGIEDIKTNFNFPILSYKIKDLIKIGGELIMQNKFCQENYTASLITKLLVQISNNYNILPYHNFTHAFSVFMMLIQCQKICGDLTKIYNQFELFIVSVAALVHDLNHKGTNSIYEIKKKSEIALVYNNESVLENMHIAQFYKMCKEYPQVDIISKIKSPIQRENAKRLLNRLILATDIQGHHKNLKKIQQIGKNKKQITQLQSFQKELILQNFFHACDIGNPCLDFNNYMNWAVLVSEEFHQQVMAQRIQKLEISSNMEFIDIKTYYQRQVGFIDYLVLPLWKEITNIFPQLEMLRAKTQANRQQLLKAIESN